MKRDIQSPEISAELLMRLRAKPDIGDFAMEVIAHPELVSQLVAVIRYEPSSIKFACDKIIRLVAEHEPALVYPYFNDIASLMDSPNSFIKWGAILTIGTLIPFDTAGRFVSIYEKYLGLIQDESMITAGNVIGQVGKILHRYPEYEPDLISRLLRVTEYTYWHKGAPSPECKNIVCGMVIDCFDQYASTSGKMKEMITFAEAQRHNTRQKVAKKAEAFVKRYAGGDT